ANPDSIYHYYRKLIQLRKQHPIIVYGDYQLLLPEDDKIYAYMRTYKNEKLLVITNFSEENTAFNIQDNTVFQAKELIISNYNAEDTDDPANFILKPYEARVYIGT